jgi:hypothetical protein
VDLEAGAGHGEGALATVGDAVAVGVSELGHQAAGVRETGGDGHEQAGHVQGAALDVGAGGVRQVVAVVDGERAVFAEDEAGADGHGDVGVEAVVGEVGRGQVDGPGVVALEAQIGGGAGVHAVALGGVQGALAQALEGGVHGHGVGGAGGQGGGGGQGDVAALTGDGGLHGLVGVVQQGDAGQVGGIGEDGQREDDPDGLAGAQALVGPRIGGQHEEVAGGELQGVAGEVFELGVGDLLAEEVVRAIGHPALLVAKASRGAKRRRGGMGTPAEVSAGPSSTPAR